MYKSILAVTDGSDTASLAVDFAAELAAKFDRPLTIGHVLQFNRPTEEMNRMAEAEHLVEHTARTSGLTYETVPGTVGDLFVVSRPARDAVRLNTIIGDEIVGRAAIRAKELGVSEVKTTVVQGDPADQILDLIDDTGAEIVVMGHRGLGRMRSMLQGSVSQKVNQQAGCTVVSVR